ncbi:hypothetical protein [Citricoccus alkalitolerans]|uniref:Integral membrane protein n=1 Tax=Citricoccus alkalitolerans TaxID=246603 RepID=A0ABV8Y2B8_9MICC
MILLRTLVTAAAGAYAANCALGISVLVRWIDTSNIRWVHHGAYLVTVTATAAAALACAARRSSAVFALTPVTVPLFLLQRHGARPVHRHTRDALTAGPCYAAGLMVAWR